MSANNTTSCSDPSINLFYCVRGFAVTYGFFATNLFMVVIHILIIWLNVLMIIALSRSRKREDPGGHCLICKLNRMAELITTYLLPVHTCHAVCLFPSSSLRVVHTARTSYDLDGFLWPFQPTTLVRMSHTIRVQSHGTFGCRLRQRIPQCC